MKMDYFFIFMFPICVILLNVEYQTLYAEVTTHRNRRSRDTTELEGNKYSPTWESLDSRPLPSWYDEAKIGIFLHWGVFSVPSYEGAWFWYYWRVSRDKRILDFIKRLYPADWTYADFAPQFKAEFFQPQGPADLRVFSCSIILSPFLAFVQSFSRLP